MALTNIEINKNADTDILFQFKDAAGKPVSLSDYTLRMQVRPKPGAAELFADLSTENGGLVIEPDCVRAKISHSDSMKFDRGVVAFDMLAIDTDGRQTRIAQGQFIVHAEVTR